MSYPGAEFFNHNITDKRQLNYTTTLFTLLATYFGISIEMYAIRKRTVYINITIMSLFCRS